MACLAWFIKLSYGTPGVDGGFLRSEGFAASRSQSPCGFAELVGAGAVLSLAVPGNKADGSIAKKRKVPRPWGLKLAAQTNPGPPVTR